MSSRRGRITPELVVVLGEPRVAVGPAGRCSARRSGRPGRSTGRATSPCPFGAAIFAGHGLRLAGSNSDAVLDRLPVAGIEPLDRERLIEVPRAFALSVSRSPAQTQHAAARCGNSGYLVATPVRAGTAFALFGSFPPSTCFMYPSNRWFLRMVST